MTYGGSLSARLRARIHKLVRGGGALAVGLSGLLHIAAAPAPPEPQSFIVVLREGTDSRGVAREHAARHQAQVQFVYEHALRGYAARVSSGAIGAIAADSRVAYVERDQTVSINTTQGNPPWGLDRIDQTVLPLSNGYSYATTGAGVTAYIIDSGIRLTHSEFGGHAVSGIDTVDGGSADDCNGHGTHVAGTVGGATAGVAKGVRLVAVRVLNCAGSGSWSGVIAGIDWVTQNHNPGSPAVANISLGGGASTAVDTAVKNSIAGGVSYAIAAGNGNQGGVAQDACKSSPARVPEAMTIGATDKTDTKASWSNYGACVDWFAPGVGISSAWITSDSATNVISGTSMATPHTAGAAARYLERFPAASPQQVRDALYASATKGAVIASKSSNNHLLFTAAGN
jgi:subtilisin family serine protease